MTNSSVHTHLERARHMCTVYSIAQSSVSTQLYAMYAALGWIGIMV